MKSFVSPKNVRLCMVLYFNCALTLSAQSTNELFAKLSNAEHLKDIQEIVHLAKQGEALWTQDAASYFEFEMRVMTALENSSVSNRAEVLAILDNVMEKTPPIKIADTQIYFEKKAFLVSKYSTLFENTADRKRLLKFAGFVGELRNNIIPNYAPPTAQLNWTPPLPPGTPRRPDGYPLTTNQAILIAYTNALEQTSLNKATGQLQRSLMKLNRELTPRLLKVIRQFMTNDSQTADFIKQIISAAHLTDEESK